MDKLLTLTANQSINALIKMTETGPWKHICSWAKPDIWWAPNQKCPHKRISDKSDCGPMNPHCIPIQGQIQRPPWLLLSRSLGYKTRCLAWFLHESFLIISHRLDYIEGKSTQLRKPYRHFLGFGGGSLSVWAWGLLQNTHVGRVRTRSKSRASPIRVSRTWCHRCSGMSMMASSSPNSRSNQKSVPFYKDNMNSSNKLSTLVPKISKLLGCIFFLQFIYREENVKTY